MAIISEGTLLTTENGYIKVEDYDNKSLVLTENGFKKIKVEEIQYKGQYVKLILWSFLDPILISSDSKALGVKYHKCLDLGSVGPCLCKPYNRCWKECPKNHPEKIHIQNPQELSFRDIRKNSYIISPKTGNISYHNFNYIENNDWNNGRNFGIKYKDLLNYMPEFNIKEIINNDPNIFMNFINGWQSSNGAGVILDMWNYRFVVKKKSIALQLQFLLNYFGTPCALRDYHSNIFGDNCYLLEFCKYKKPFHYKTWDYLEKRYITIKKWTPFSTDKNTHNVKWYKVSKINDAKYFCCPFLCKLEDK